MKPQIRAVRGELLRWLDQQIDPQIRRAAGAVAGDLGAALIGARVHPVVKANLIENVARLACSRSAQGR